MKWYATCLEGEGLQQLELALVNTSASCLVDLINTEVHGANMPTPPPSRTPSPNFGRQWTPSSMGQSPKRACCSPTLMMLASPKDHEATLQVVPIPSGPTEAIAGPSGSSMLLTELQKGPPVLCCVPELSPLAKAFKWVNLKDSIKMYMCRKCDRLSQDQDTMVSHYLTEHLRVHLVCPQCGMSYLDP